MKMPDGFNEFEFLEPILSLRTVLLQELLALPPHDQNSRGMKNSLLEGIVRHCELVSKLARHAGRYQVRNTTRLCFVLSFSGSPYTNSLIPVIISRLYLHMFE